jgi:hypothetical protein
VSVATPTQDSNASPDAEGSDLRHTSGVAACGIVGPSSDRKQRRRCTIAGESDSEIKSAVWQCIRRAEAPIGTASRFATAMVM